MVGIVTYNSAYYLAVFAGGAGLLFWASGLLLWREECRRRDVVGLRGSGEHRDRLIVGTALVLTAFVIVALRGGHGS